ATTSAALEAKLEQDGMMVAGTIAGGAVDHLAANHLDAVVGENVVDAHARALIEIDKVGWNGVAPTGPWNGVAQSKLRQARKYLSAALDETVDGELRIAGKVAEALDQQLAVDHILRTDRVEIPAHQQRPLHGGQHGGEVERLVLGMAQGVGVVGCHVEGADRRGDRGTQPTTIVDAQLRSTRDGMLAQNGVAPGTVVEGRSFVGKGKEAGIVDDF